MRSLRPMHWLARRLRSISSQRRRNTKWSAKMKRPPRSLRSLPPEGAFSRFGRPCATDMDRRDFLCRTAALSTAGLAGVLDFFPLAAQAATTDYKALVCVFLFGGVDGNNVLVPTDTAGYGAYTAVRGASSGIQLTQAELLPIAPLA